MLRPSLVPNLLSSARFLPFLLPQRRLFEIGRTFHFIAGQPTERRTVAWVILLSGGRSSWHNPDSQPDFYTVKAEAEAVLEFLGLQATVPGSSAAPFPFLTGKSCCLVDSAGEIVGHIGEVEHRAYGLKPVRLGFAVEIYLPPPVSAQKGRMRPPRCEADSFDISLLVNTHTRVPSIQQRIEQVLGQDLIAVRLSDVYDRTQIGADVRSFTFRVVYARRRGEPAAVWQEIATMLTQALGVQVRGANA